MTAELTQTQRGAIYWLASYPKSGNTWSRALLANYFSNSDEPADINALGGGPIASARQPFDDNIGIEASDLTQDEIERLRPAVYEAISDKILKGRAEAEANPPKANADPDDDNPVMPPIFKVHDAFTQTPDGVPLLSKKATAGAIYLLRNPIDVVPSFAHHSGRSIEKMIKRMAKNDMAFVSGPAGLHNQLRQWLLTWSEHVLSWVDEPDLPILVVRYEDMMADTHSALSSIIDFLEVPVDEGRIAKAVEFSAFKKLAAQESEKRFGEMSPAADSFFRKGIVGDGYNALTQEQIDQVTADHREVMERFGYLDK